MIKDMLGYSVCSLMFTSGFINVNRRGQLKNAIRRCQLLLIKYFLILKYLLHSIQSVIDYYNMHAKEYSNIYLIS